MKQTSMTAWIAGAAVGLLLAGAASAAIKEEAVTYKDGDTVLKGFVVYDDASAAKRPGIIVVPTWWGINKHMHDEARLYASSGYTAFIADMIGEGQSLDNPKEAGPPLMLMRKNPSVMLSRFNAAKGVLSKQMTVDASRIGAAGYSGGGAFALDAVRAGSDLKGVAGFYVGMLPSTLAPADAGKITSKLLIMNGGADPLVKSDVVDAFKKEMADANVDLRYISYPGARHSYTDPDATEKGKQFNIPFAYDAEATSQSRAEALKFFGEVFK
ncbi:MAG: dienelactone hydrolase family protein [Gammaproteobacteria bacterium]|jgi:dienelactone hydrolase|nr:dienelactone hydrolase family protein [Gammaproteobacteria bacterium]